MRGLEYVVYSIKDYRGGAEDILSTYVRLDSYLFINNERQFLDSSVYTLPIFQEVHEVLTLLNSKLDKTVFSYSYNMYSLYIENLKLSIDRLLDDI